MKKLAKGQAQSRIQPEELNPIFPIQLKLRKEESKAWGSELSYLKKGNINNRSLSTFLRQEIEFLYSLRLKTTLEEPSASATN